MIGSSLQSLYHSQTNTTLYQQVDTYDVQSNLYVSLFTKHIYIDLVLDAVEFLSKANPNHEFSWKRQAPRDRQPTFPQATVTCRYPLEATANSSCFIFNCTTKTLHSIQNLSCNLCIRTIRQDASRTYLSEEQVHVVLRVFVGNANEHIPRLLQKRKLRRVKWHRSPDASGNYDRAAARAIAQTSSPGDTPVSLANEALLQLYSRNQFLVPFHSTVH